MDERVKERGGKPEDLLHARYTVFRRREELSDSKAAFAKVAVLKSPFSGDFPTKATEGQKRLCRGPLTSCQNRYPALCEGLQDFSLRLNSLAK